jgi:branched-chain amino acid transport system ATP-binding protein
VTARLEVSGLTVQYGGAMAVTSAFFAIQPGETVVLAGPNGAGKSTLLRAVMGLAPIAAGGVAIDGVAVEMLPAARRAGLGVGYCPDARRLFPGLTVAENLVVGAASSTSSGAAVAAALKLFPALSALLPKRAWRLSGGQQQMVALARAFGLGTHLTLLDEPLAGLAPPVAESVLEALCAMTAAGRTVLIADRADAAFAGVATRTLAMNRGSVVL